MRFVMIGGFLGAGKTTTIGRLASHYRAQGQNVGIVTNDQASDLVDTLALRSKGFDVGEVAGACFCCNFNDLTDTIQSLAAEHRPDVIIAEPVGSCTDLIATVVQPMKQLFPGGLDVAPFGVILKPSHGQKILSGQKNVGFSPKAAYIFTKQLEEADFAILNHIDRLSDEQVNELQELMTRHYPETPLVRFSAMTGKGMDDLVEMISRRGEFGNRILDIDYDLYAEGEAELGWLNSSLKLEANSDVELDQVILGLVREIGQTLLDQSAEVAHLKVIGLWQGAHGVANLTSSDGEAVLSLPSDCKTRQADLVVNARVAMDPDALHRVVESGVEQMERQFSSRIERIKTQYFQPGRPEPTHRFGSA